MPYYVVAAATVYSAYSQNKSIDKASELSADATQSAAQLEQARYEQNRADMAPWRESGKKALGSLDNLMYSEDRGAALKDRPGYQFRLDEGLRALSRRAAAGSVTGRTYRAMVDYGQNTASNEYMNEFNRLSGMAGTGQVATQFSAQQGAQSAANQGGYLQQAADTRGSAYMGRSKVIGDALGSLASGAYGKWGGGKPSIVSSNVDNSGNFTGSPATSPYYANDYRPPGGSFMNTPGY